jgi:hypothetical protein
MPIYKQSEDHTTVEERAFAIQARTVLATSLHPRLGAQSKLRWLFPEIIAMIGANL